MIIIIVIIIIRVIFFVFFIYFRECGGSAAQRDLWQDFFLVKFREQPRLRTWRRNQCRQCSRSYLIASDIGTAARASRDGNTFQNSNSTICVHFVAARVRGNYLNGISVEFISNCNCDFAKQVYTISKMVQVY